VSDARFPAPSSPSSGAERRAPGTGPARVLVGVQAPEAMAPKIAYALEQLLIAARVPHRVERVEHGRPGGGDTGWDLFYGDSPPSGDGLWMQASADAWRFFERSGIRVERVSTAAVAGKKVRVPVWGASSRGGGSPFGNLSSPSAGGGQIVPVDLAAAAFFFLSRWEEWQSGERDTFGRFPLAASVFGRGLWSLTECPVENYALALRRALAAAPRTAWLAEQMEGSCWQVDAPPTARPSAFVVGLSHDIDTIRRWDGRGFARAGCELGRMLLRGRPGEAAGALVELFSGLWLRIAGFDPHCNLDGIVALEQAIGARSTFFLLCRHAHRWDGTHAGHYQRLLPSLARGLATEAELGVHASTMAAGHSRTDDPGPGHALPLRTNILDEERHCLEALIGAPVRGVRFHNLRGGYSALSDVAAAGFDYDSTLGFAEAPGFSAGIARPFHPYDRERDRPLDLVTVPLVLMDTTLLSPRYLGLPVTEGRTRAVAALEPLRHWGGAASLLWHNDNLPPNEAHGYSRLYAELIEWTRAAGGAAASLAEIVDEWQRQVALLQERDKVMR
jgi:hypothetical protein